MLRDIINKNLVSVRPDARIREIANLMEKKDVGSVLILQNGKIRGIVTDRDIVLRCLSKNLNPDDCCAEDIMTESLKTVRETDGIFDCIKAMKDAGVRRIPVVDNQGKAVGIVSFGDLLAMLSQELIELTEATTPTVEEAEKRKAA